MANEGIREASVSNGAKATIATLFRENPSVWLCAFGFACALLTWYPGRVGVNLNYAFQAYGALTDIIVIVFLVALVILWIVRPDFRLSSSMGAIVAVGVAASAVLLAQILINPDVASVSPGIAIALECLYKLLSVLLLVLWFEQVDRFPARLVILIMGTGCLMLALLELLIVGLQQSATGILFALSPIMSMAALAGFLKQRAGEPGFSDGAGVSEARTKLVVPITMICLGVVMLTAIGSSIQAFMRHFAPISNSSRSGSKTFQYLL